MIDAFFDIIEGESPVFFLIAGPNGAGKSTFRKRRIDPYSLACIDPDEVALKIFKRHPRTKEEALTATMEATQRVKQLFIDGHTVCLESVFSDTKGHKLELIQQAKSHGYKTCLIFIGIESSQLCIARVTERVNEGGHDVPDELIEERFPRCFENARKAISLVDAALLVDNSELDSHREFGYFVNGITVHLDNNLPFWFSQVCDQA